MDKEKQSLFQRIRNAKQSLENAEKSFQDNRGMRGELDLMLAEAELKNLRNKQSDSWSWNRNTFALCIAILLFVAGLCGWYFAKGEVQPVEIVKVPTVVQQKTEKKADTQNTSAKANDTDVDIEKNKKTINTLPSKNEETSTQILLSEKDMRSLVRSAKSELSSGK